MLYTLIHTAYGWLAIGGEGGRIARLSLPRPSREEAITALTGGMPVELVETERDFTEIVDQVDAYFEGECVDFRCELDFGEFGEFDRRVWEATRTIGYGETRSYSWVAHRIGRYAGARAVGQSLKKNPLPLLVPCHRVVRANGCPGGFSSGITWKLRLLELERRGRRTEDCGRGNRE